MASTTSELLLDLVCSKAAFFDQRHNEAWWRVGVAVLLMHGEPMAF